MGKGRNNRHKKRRREQSRNARRELKKQKKAEEKKWKNQPNPPPNKRKRKRKKGKNMPMYREQDVEFIHLGMSGKFLIEPYNQYMSQFKEWYDEGVFTDISFVVSGNWDTKTRNRLHGLLKDNGHEWAVNHLIFKTPREYDAQFLTKRIKYLKITHYIDMDKNNITKIVMSNLYGRVKIFCWNNKDIAAGAEDFKTWLKEYNPVHYNLFDQGESAADIIQTGLYAKPEEVETFTSQGYENGDGWINEILEAT